MTVHLKSKIAINIPGQKLDDYTWRTHSVWAEGSFISSEGFLPSSVNKRMDVVRVGDRLARPIRPTLDHCRSGRRRSSDRRKVGRHVRADYASARPTARRPSCMSGMPPVGVVVVARSKSLAAK